jgi:hypothetical protein
MSDTQLPIDDHIFQSNKREVTPGVLDPQLQTMKTKVDDSNPTANQRQQQATKHEINNFFQKGAPIEGTKREVTTK